MNNLFLPKDKRYNELSLFYKGRRCYVSFDEIVCIVGDANYSVFILRNGLKIASSYSLKSYTELLDSTLFYRTSKSYIVNINYADRLVLNGKRSTNHIVLTNGLQCPIARRRLEVFLQHYRSYKKQMAN